MPLSVACPTCAARLSVPDSAAGKTVKCPKCQYAMAIPEPEEDNGFELVEAAAPPRRATPVAAPRLRPIRDEVDEERPARRRRRDEDDEDDYEEEDRPRRPKKKKARKKSGGTPVGLIVGLVVGLLVVVGGGVGAFLLLRSSDSEQVQPAVARQTETFRQSAPKVPAGWQTFTTPGAGMSVAVPARLEPFSIPGGGRRPGVSVRMWQVVQGEVVYQVQVITPDRAPPKSGISDRELDRMADGIASGANMGRVLNRKQVSVSGHNGRQIELRQGGKHALIRFTIVGRHAYVLSVIGLRAVSDSDDDIAPFFDSARISE